MGHCEATCTVPSTTGYAVGAAGGTLTIDGFAPSGVTCAGGYTGTVSYTVCGSAGTAYSLSGCKARQSIIASSASGCIISWLESISKL